MSAKRPPPAEPRLALRSVGTNELLWDTLVLCPEMDASGTWAIPAGVRWRGRRLGETGRKMGVAGTWSSARLVSPSLPEEKDRLFWRAEQPPQPLQDTLSQTSNVTPRRCLSAHQWSKNRYCQVTTLLKAKFNHFFSHLTNTKEFTRTDSTREVNFA